MAITKKVIMVLDVVSPLLLAATSMAVAVALYKILTLYDFYRNDPAFPGAKVLIFFGLAFFLPQGLASITALGWRDFWLPHLRPRAMSRGMSVTKVRLVELYAPMVIAMSVPVPSLIYCVNSV